jgi:hypothetical protein
MSAWIENHRDWLGPQDRETKAKKKEPSVFGEAVEYIPIRCTMCGSKKIRCYKTMEKDEIIGRIYRYHICLNCNCKFSSFEEE